MYEDSNNLCDSNPNVTNSNKSRSEKLELELFDISYNAPNNERVRLNEIEQKVDALTEAVKSQNESIQALSTLLTRVANQLLPKSNELKIFPLRNLKQLENVDTMLERYSEAEILKCIKQFINSRKIQKCFGGFFHNDLLLDINWDGKYEKKAIKDFKLFKTYIFESVKAENNMVDYNAYVHAMREGFRLAKNRQYKKKHMKKKNQSKLNYKVKKT